MTLPLDSRHVGAGNAWSNGRKAGNKSVSNQSLDIVRVYLVVRTYYVFYI